MESFTCDLLRGIGFGRSVIFQSDSSLILFNLSHIQPLLTGTHSIRFNVINVEWSMSRNHKWDLIPDKSEISDKLTNQLQAEAKMLHSRPRPLCKSYIVLKISDVQIIWYWIKNCANLIHILRSKYLKCK